MAKRSTHRKSRCALPLKEASAEVVAAPETAALQPRKLLRWLHGGMALLLTTLCVGLYAWTADFPLVFDDYVYLKDNPVFHQVQGAAFPWGDLEGFLAKSREQPDLAVNAALRPVAYATFGLNYALDGFTPRWYRVINVVIHAVNGWLLFMLLLRLGAGLVERGWMERSSAFFVAVTTSLIFTVHPLATESVTYIIQRFTSLGTLFLLGSLLLYLRSLNLESRRSTILWRGAAVLGALAGMLTKEDVATVPLLAVLLDWLVLGTGLLRSLRRALPLLLCLPLVPLMVAACGAVVHGGGWSLSNALNLTTPLDRPIARLDYLISEIPVVVEYLWLLLWPTGQNLYPQPPLLTTWTEPAVLRGAAVLLSVAVGCVLLLWLRLTDGRARLLAAGVLWFSGTLFVSSGLVPLPDLMAEHRTYLPSVGLLVAVVCILDWMRLGFGAKGRMALQVSVGVVVVALSLLTCVRNTVWRSNTATWRDTVTKSPQSYKAWGNLGAALAESGKYEEGLECFRKALKIEPCYYDAYVNQSTVLFKLNRWKECYEATTDTLQKMPVELHRGKLLFNLGLSLAGLNRIEEAERAIKQAIECEPEHYEAHKILGMLHFTQKRRDLALNYLNRALQMKPDDLQVQQMLQQLADG